MSEQRQILELWKQARAAKEEVCLATVVRTEGSSYRKPGARMLLTHSGRRAGTISGGCLEAEIQKKAWWLCAKGPVVERYSSSFDGDAEIPYGLACGGTIWVLLERGDRTTRILQGIADCVEHCIDVAFVCLLDSRNNVGTQTILRQDGQLFAGSESNQDRWIHLARETLEMQISQCIETPDGLVFAEYMPSPQRLFVFGAGDDVQPVVQFAYALGWQVTVVDGRSHLATRARFPLAHFVCLMRSSEEALYRLQIGPRDAVTVMSHSYEQDRNVLQHVIAIGPAYLGILGPRHRTDWLMQDIVAGRGSREMLHTPAGLDLGAEGPAAIALSIIAEIQSVLAKREKGQRRNATALSAMMTA